MFSLEGQTALVTGGTRGIGQAAAIALAEAGADIILIQVDSNFSFTSTTNFFGPVLMRGINRETMLKTRH